MSSKRINNSLYSNSSCKNDTKQNKELCSKDLLSEDEYYDCRYCQRDFRTENGRVSHESRMHKKEYKKVINKI